MEQAAMAPALTSGVVGWSFSRRMENTELNGSPVASAPIFSSTISGDHCFIASMAVATLETDSMPKS